MKTLRINVKDKIATYFQRDGVIVCSNKGYKIAFTFDDEWGEYTTKTARFIWNGKYYDQEFTNDECPVPVINDATEVTVGVYAGDLKTTTPAEIPCLISILCGTPEIANGKEYRDIAQQAAEEARQAAEEAKAAAEIVVHPTIAVEEIEGGHRVIINDADGEKNFDVMDGDGSGSVTLDSVDASKVVFGEDVYTGYAVGNVILTNGRGLIAKKGETLLEREKRVWSKTTYPSKTEPSVSLTFSQAGSYEAGTVITPTYIATFDKGSYTLNNPDTGVTLEFWTVTDSSGNSDPRNDGEFPSFVVDEDTNYKITATATHSAGIVPKDSEGNSYAAAQIKSGTKSKTSGAVTGYRNSFYGTLTNKNTLTSNIIRNNLTASGWAMSNGSTFNVYIPVGALRVVIAYPATLGDITSIKDVNGMNAEISSSFAKQTINVEGAKGYTAISYNVYTLDFANANDTANEYTVTI